MSWSPSSPRGETGALIRRCGRIGNVRSRLGVRLFAARLERVARSEDLLRAFGFPELQQEKGGLVARIFSID